MQLNGTLSETIRPLEPPNPGRAIPSLSRAEYGGWRGVRSTALFRLNTGFLILLAGLRLSAVTNDNFVNRAPLAGTNIMVIGSNADASKETGEPNHANNNVGGRSVWWAW